MEKSVGKEFIENTKYTNMPPAPQVQGVPQPLLESTRVDYQEVISLLPPDKKGISPVDLTDAIERRESIRKYVMKPVTLEELSYLLWCTQGVKIHNPGQATFRTVPSAGARHAFDTYILANRVIDLQPGLYRYAALDHSLYQISLDPDLPDRMAKACLGQDMVKRCATCFIWVAVTERMTWRYGERGYRYLFLDAGHVCQNLYLSAETIHSGVCAIGAFSDDAVNELLELNGRNEFVIYMASLGKK